MRHAVLQRDRLKQGLVAQHIEDGCKGLVAHHCGLGRHLHQRRRRVKGLRLPSDHHPLAAADLTALVGRLVERGLHRQPGRLVDQGSHQHAGFARVADFQADPGAL